MEGAGLNYKKLVTAMSVMTLAAVYTAACIALPRLVKNPVPLLIASITGT